MGALAQTLGRTAIPFIKKYIISAARRIGADLFEIAAPEITNVELVEPDPFLEKVDRKTVALAKTFLTIEKECKPKSFLVRGF